MAQDGKVAYAFQPFAMLRYSYSGSDIEAKCSVSEMKTRLTSYFTACLLGASSNNHGINCETEH